MISQLQCVLDVRLAHLAPSPSASVKSLADVSLVGIYPQQYRVRGHCNSREDQVMKQCCHCKRTHSPCWRKGPPEKPLLCNACGAHYLCKRSLDNYWPKEASNIHQQSYLAEQHNRQRHTVPLKSIRPRDANLYLAAAAHPAHSKQPWMQQQVALQADSGASSISQPSSSQSEDAAAAALTEAAAAAAAECTSPRTLSKQPRLVSCRVYEVDPQTATALRLLKTFETAEGVVLTVIRRPRKQARPRACAVM